MWVGIIPVCMESSLDVFACDFVRWREGAEGGREKKIVFNKER